MGGEKLFAVRGEVESCDGRTELEFTWDSGVGMGRGGVDGP
jgi:hypothetical protein